MLGLFFKIKSKPPIFLRFIKELSKELYLVSLCSLGVGLLQVFGVIITTCMFSIPKDTQKEKKGTKLAMKQGYWRSL